MSPASLKMFMVALINGGTRFSWRERETKKEKELKNARNANYRN